MLGPMAQRYGRLTVGQPLDLSIPQEVESLLAHAHGEGRRPAKWLDELVQAVVETRGPISAHWVAVLFDEWDLNIRHSAVFRAMQSNVDRGYVQKIEHTKAYVSWNGVARINLICTNCGGHEWQAAPPELLGAVRSYAESNKFFDSTIILESSGICSICYSKRHVP